ncbi:MAG: hypothetical protein H6837_01765 [Planctomycetes bacterium]|nr:hypothetical protein [Planctomycetota bacterium]
MRGVLARVGLLSGLVSLSGLCSCDEHPSIGVTRVRDNGRKVELDRSVRDRFFKQSEGEREGGSNEARIAEMLRWKLPEGWQQLPVRPLRIVNLRKGEVQCYVSFLTGGGAVENLNRWRKQMGQPALDPAAIAKLKTHKLLGRDAHRLDLQGTYSGMGGTKDDQRMVATFAQFPAFAMSVLMLGPRAAVDVELAAYDGFCGSLEFDPSKVSGASRGGGTEEAAGHGGPSLDPTKLRFEPPASWAKIEGHPMRLVTYGTSGGGKCSVTVLPGAAGGLPDNVNRWLGQIGAAPLDAAGIAALPKVKALGAEHPMVAGYGKTDGVVATVVRVQGDSVFVKLEGKSDVVRAEANNFVKFCASLRIEK